MKIVVMASFAKSLVHLRSELLAEMVAAGHEVVACAPGREEPFVGRVEALGVRYETIRLDRTGTNPLSDLAYLRDMFRLLRKERPDVVFGYTAKPVVFGSLAAWLAGVPHIYSMITGLGHAFASKGIKQTLLSVVMRLLYRLGLSVNTRVFFQNPDDAGLFTRWGLVRAERVVTINGSGVNLDHYAVIPRITSPPIFLLIGRVLKDKGVREYGAAAAILKKRYPHAVFRILGPHDDHPSSVPWAVIQEWVDKGVVEYYPETEDVRPALAQAGIYVLPSYREGTPRSVLEAMAMGRPVVTTDATGCRETVTDGDNGFLVPVGDADALARAMEKFILKPELIEKMGIRGREIAEEKYDVRKVNGVILRTMGLER